VPAAVVRIEGQFDDTQFKKLQTTLGRLGVEIAGVEKTAGASFAAIGAQLSKTGANIASFGKNWSTHITAPLALIGGLSVKTAADFETTMNSLQVNAAATGKEMDSLSSLALKMGADTVFSAGEAADAMLELSKGGLEPASISGGALQASLNLAATEGMGLADASTIIVQSMNTFGISAKDTTKVVDLLAAGAVASTASVEDLAAGMKYVGATAANLNVPMSSVVTALAAMNNAGIDSTTAGTSLNRMLLGLIPTTRKATEEAAALGLEFLNQDGSIKSMDKVVKELVDTYGSMGDAARTASLKTVFGVEGMRAANILIAEGVDGYAKLEKAVNKQGVAQDMANARMSGTAGALEAMRGSLDTAAIKIGDALAPTVRSLAGFLTDLTNKFTALDPRMQTAIVTIGGVVAAVGPAIFVMGKLVSGVGSVFTLMSKAPAVFSAVATGAKSLWGVLAANPMLAIAAAVAVVAVLIISNWDKISAFLIDTWRNIQNVAAAVWNGIKNFFQGIGNWFNQNFTAFFTRARDGIVGSWNAIRNVAGNVWNGIKDVVLGVARAIWNGIETYVGMYVNAFTTAFNAIRSVVTTVMNGVVGAIKGAVNSIIGGINWLIRGLNRVSFNFPSWVPVVGGKSFGINIPEVPMLAKGGIVTEPTLAVIGEAGPEAVIPLNSSRANGYGTGGITIAPGAVQITIQGGADSGTVSTIQRVVDEALMKLAREVRYA
jgi:TP901 family phage tail tape measure protein